MGYIHKKEGMKLEGGWVSMGLERVGGKVGGGEYDQNRLFEMYEILK